MFPKRLFIIIVFLILIIGFSNKILAVPNGTGTTIEIEQDLSKPLISNNPNSLSIENNEVIIQNNDSEKIKLFNLDESDTNVFITLIDNANKLLIYKNGGKVNSLSLKNIDISSLIDNLQNSYAKEEITSLKIYGYTLSPKRVLKNYLDIAGNDTNKTLKAKIVSDSNLKLYYSASNIDNMSTFATSSTMTNTWANLSGSTNNGTLTSFALAPSPTTSSGQIVTSGWDGNNIYSNPSRLTFDGVNDYVQPADSSPFNFTATTPFTIEFWVSTPNLLDPLFRYIISKGTSISNGYQIFIFAQALYVRLAGSELLSTGILLHKLFFPANIWKHVVVSYDGTLKASGVKIYYDGVLQSTDRDNDLLDKFTKFDRGDLRLGLTSFGGTSFVGSLGDVRIYNKALSGTEALQNFQSEQSKYFQAPKITTLSPADNSTDVTVQSDLVINFDRVVNIGTGNIRIKKSSNDSVVEIIDVTSNRVTTTSTKTATIATINPVNNLIRNTTYYIEIDQNTFQGNGISFPGISDSTTWNFTTVNDSAPQAKVTAFSPENGSQSVPVASSLVITFDKNIYPGTGVLNIFNEDEIVTNHDPVEVINVNSTAVTGAGTTMITIKPSMNFLSDTSYLIATDPSAFQDGAGINSRTLDLWRLLTVDTTPINVMSLSPADDATNVPANTNLQINFNKSVTADKGKIYIKKVSDNSTVENINVNSNAVTGSETDTIVINPVMDLAEDTQYYINIDQGAFKDTAGNVNPGITDNVTWNFRTADTTAPVINTLSPTNGFNKVNVNSDLVIVFSEPVKTNTGNVTITKLTAEVTPPVETISVTSNAITGSGTNTLAINPPVDLEEDVRYFINIDSTAFTDLAGNAFAGISNRSTWNFTTVDITAPTITNLSPADNATKINVNSNLDITFSEVVSPQVGGKKFNIFKSANNALIESIDVTNNAVTGNGTNIITVNPAMDFSENTDYFITIAQGAFADFYGNAFAGILNPTTWNFKTADTTEPTVIGLSPANNANNVNVQSSLIITFNEPVTANTGNITIKTTQGDSILETISATSNAVTGSMTNTITINPSTNLNNGTNYYINIDPGAFLDLAGNAFSGISNNAVWNFTTVINNNGGSAMFTDAPNISTSSSGSSSSSSSSGSSLSSSSSTSSSSSSSSSSGSLMFNSDGSLSILLVSPVTITGPNSIKLPNNKARLTASHTKVENEIKCSVIPLGDVKIKVKPKSLSFTPTINKVDISLTFKSKNVLKARKKKDKSERNIQIKVLCDDGENNLDIKILP